MSKMLKSMRKLSPAYYMMGLCFFVSVLTNVPHIAAQKMGNEVTEGLAAAESHYTQQEYAQAEEELRAILAQVPGNYAANELLGLVLTAEGRDADATSFFEKAVRTSPASVPARENLAANYAKRKMNALAEIEFKALLRLDPKNFDLQHNCGEFFVSLGKIGEALAPLKAAQLLKPDDYSNGYDLSLAEMMSGRLTEAEAQVQSLLALKDNAELHSLLAEVYEKQSRFLPAAKEYQRAAQMEPTESSIFDWGAELLRHKNLQEAAQVFESGVTLYPQSWRLSTGLGLARHMLGNDQGAVAPLIHAVDIAAADPRSYYFLSMLGRVPAIQAVQVTSRFERYAADNPKSAQAQLYYAINLWQADETSSEVKHGDKVEALLKRAVALDPSLAQAYMQLGILYARREDNPRAAAEFVRAIKLDPHLAVAHYRLAQTLNRLGQRKQAAQEMETFRKLDSAGKQEETVMAFLLTRQDKPQ
jgi:tetratricopeptide (TPR) repeat protein